MKPKFAPLARLLFVISSILGALTSSGTIHLRHLPVNENLASNMLNAIYQDADGFMYFGTASGLHRFDGYRVSSYVNIPGDTTSIIDNYVQDIQPYVGGMLLIRAGDKYCIFDPYNNRFDRYVPQKLKKHNIDHYPELITMDGRDVWLYVRGNGILRYSQKNGIEKVSGIDGFTKSTDVTDLIVGQDHREAFAVTEQGKVLIINTGTMSLKSVADTPDNDDTNKVYSLFADRDGILWVYAESGLYAYDRAHSRWTNSFAGADWPMEIPAAITQDRKGRIWIGYNHGGLAVLNKNGSIERIRNVENDIRSLPANTVTALFEDKAGTMWIGTRKKGVSVYNESAYKFDFHKFPDVNCIIPSRDGNLWIGTDSDGLFLTDGNFKVLKSYGNGQNSDAVVCLLEARDGTLYAGTYAGGLMRLKGGVLTNFKLKDGLASENVWALRELPDGRIIIATLGGGLQILNPSDMKFETFNLSNSGLTSTFTTSLSSDENGNFYVGTSDGVAIFRTKDKTISMFTGTKDNHLTNLNVNQVFVDSRGLVWIATRSGLNIYNPAKDRLMELEINAFPGQDFIRGITEDKNHSIWVSIGGNLTNIVVSPDVNGDFPKFSFHNYNSSDGLQNCDFNQRSFCVLPSGEMLVGGLYGINSFKPESIIFDTYAPMVKFTGMNLFNQNVRVGEKYDGNIILPVSIDYLKEIKLNHSQNDFTIFFSTDDYVLPEKTIFSYRLEGFNNDWNELSPGEHQVSYTNLSPGVYTLQVKATNNDGISSSDVKSIIIRITPSWYATIFAKIIYLLIAISVLILAIYLVKKRERRRYLAKIREEKHKKQEDLNQLKFKFFTNISHELRTPLTLITAPLDSMIAKEADDGKKKKLNIMRANANRLLMLVNQILDFRKNEMSGLTFHPSSGNIVSFARQICDSFLTFSEKRNIDFSFTTTSDTINMVFDEDKMGKTIMNLLSNAFKYTPDGGTVHMDIAEDGKILRIRVSDTGKGISDDDKRHIFERFFQSSDNDRNTAGSGIGLSLVAEYVKLHDGVVTVSDNPGGGSIFEISVPIRKVEIHRNHSPENDVRNDSAAATSSEEELPKILIVDDNIDLLELLKDELETEYQAMTATNGKIALDIIRNAKPDLIISDIMMPVMDGIELCRVLKSDASTASIPLIILTAKHDVGAKIEGLTLGADEYLTKPFNIEEVKLRITKLLSLKQKGMKRSLIDPEPQKIEITSLDEKFIEKAVKYVEKNIDNSDLTVEEMSSAIGMSRVHLYKKIKHLTGKTPIEFIRVIRLKRAAQLLRESQLNVSEIAYKCGFNNPKYFSRYFKDEFGVLPSVYQDNMAK